MGQELRCSGEHLGEHVELEEIPEGERQSSIPSPTTCRQTLLLLYYSQSGPMSVRLLCTARFQRLVPFFWIPEQKSVSHEVADQTPCLIVFFWRTSRFVWELVTYPSLQTESRDQPNKKYYTPPGVHCLPSFKMGVGSASCGLISGNIKLQCRGPRRSASEPFFKLLAFSKLLAF